MKHQTSKNKKQWLETYRQNHLTSIVIWLESTDCFFLNSKNPHECNTASFIRMHADCVFNLNTELNINPQSMKPGVLNTPY